MVDCLRMRMVMLFLAIAVGLARASEALTFTPLSDERSVATSGRVAARAAARLPTDRSRPRASGHRSTLTLPNRARLPLSSLRSTRSGRTSGQALASEYSTRCRPRFTQARSLASSSPSTRPPTIAHRFRLDTAQTCSRRSDQMSFSTRTLFFAVPPSQHVCSTSTFGWTTP